VTQLSSTPPALSIASLLPQAQFGERHKAKMRVTPQHALDAIETLSDADEPIIRWALKLREAPARIAAAIGLPSGLRGKSRFGIADFTLLERSDTEAFYGLAGRFWRPDFGLEPIADADSFLAFDKPGVARLVLSFTATPIGDGEIRLTTETRVFCPDRRSLFLFTPYWLLIRPFSGLIRNQMLRLIASKASACPPRPAQ